MLHGVEPHLMSVRVVQKGQDPADACSVNAAMPLAECVQVCGELVDCGVVGHADDEVVESGRGLGPIRIQPKGERRPTIGWFIKIPISFSPSRNSTTR